MMPLHDGMVLSSVEVKRYRHKHKISLREAKDELQRAALFSRLFDMRHREGDFHNATVGVVLGALLDLLLNSVDLPMRPEPKEMGDG